MRSVKLIRVAKTGYIILSAAFCALSALLVLNPGVSARALTVLLGGALLAEGILNLAVALCAVKIVRNQQPDIVEAHFDNL